MDKILQFEKREEDDYYAILGCDELSTVSQSVIGLFVSIDYDNVGCKITEFTEFLGSASFILIYNCTSMV